MKTHKQAARELAEIGKLLYHLEAPSEDDDENPLPMPARVRAVAMREPRALLAAELVRRTVQPSVRVANSMAEMPHVVGDCEELMGGALSTLLCAVWTQNNHPERGDVLLIDGSNTTPARAFERVTAHSDRLRDLGSIGLLIDVCAIVEPEHREARAALTRWASIDQVEVRGPLALVTATKRQGGWAVPRTLLRVNDRPVQIVASLVGGDWLDRLP